MLERLKRSKLWTAFGGDVMGITFVEQGLNTTGIESYFLIIGGICLALASTLSYIRVQGNIDKVKEEISANSNRQSQ